MCCRESWNSCGRREAALVAASIQQQTWQAYEVAALASEQVQKHLEGKEPKKIMYVTGELL